MASIYVIKLRIMDDVKLKIYQFIQDKLGVEESAITKGASFYGDLDVDSLDFCELIVDIEKAFDISIPDDVYEKFGTVGSLIDYVSKQAGSNTSKVSHLQVVSDDRMSA